MSKHSSKQEKDLITHKNNLAKYKKRFNEIDIIIENLYEDKIKGSIDVRRLITMMKSYEEKQKEIQEQIKHHSLEIEEFNLKVDGTEKFMKIINNYSKLKELNSEILNEFIEKIHIHEAITEENIRNQQIDIYYKFIGLM